LQLPWGGRTWKPLDQVASGKCAKVVAWSFSSLHPLCNFSSISQKKVEIFYCIIWMKSWYKNICILWMISCIFIIFINFNWLKILIKSFHTMDEKYPLLLRAIWVGNHGSLRLWPHFPWNHGNFP
jgi:hypothetical protein